MPPMPARDRHADVLGFGREFGLHLGDPGLHSLALAQHGGLLAGDILLQRRGGGAIGRFLRHPSEPVRMPPSGPMKTSARSTPVIGQHKLPRLIRMLHAARLDDGQRAGALARLLQVAQHQPGVDQRGDADLALLGRVCRHSSGWSTGR